MLCSVRTLVSNYVRTERLCVCVCVVASRELNKRHCGKKYLLVLGRRLPEKQSETERPLGT